MQIWQLCCTVATLPLSFTQRPTQKAFMHAPPLRACCCFTDMHGPVPFYGVLLQLRDQMVQLLDATCLRDTYSFLLSAVHSCHALDSSAYAQPATTALAVPAGVLYCCYLLHNTASKVMSHMTANQVRGLWHQP